MKIMVRILAQANDLNRIIKYRIIEIFFLLIDPCAIGKSTPLIYFRDDIRLCTIQRVIPEQPLGIFLHYHRHERFHYIKLSDDYQSTLAFCAGIKPFDRVIEYNGINIENDSAETFQKTIDDIRDQPFQLLVCDPVTYAYYKKNHKHLHSKLDTIKHHQSVRDTEGKNAKFN